MPQHTKLQQAAGHLRGSDQCPAVTTSPAENAANTVATLTPSSRAMGADRMAGK
jgi:hypothetical protein